MFDGENCYRCGKWHKFEELTADARGFSFCGRCAAKFSNEGKEKRRCPDDNREMVKRAYGPFAVDKCEACGGVWLDADELRALTEFIKREPWRRGFLTGIFFP
jgi:hypothetical protein